MCSMAGMSFLDVFTLPVSHCVDATIFLSNLEAGAGFFLCEFPWEAMNRLPAARGVLALRPRVQPVVHSRAFWNVSLPVLSGAGGAHITKYHIVKPGKEGVEWDDFLLALPERDQLATFSKEVPLFIRYLKVVTDQEGRSVDFAQFLERAKSGLVVENDVFISTEEILALMWKNGYSEQDMLCSDNTRE